jgi:non-specific serine/threonine protein kinase
VNAQAAALAWQTGRRLSTEAASQLALEPAKVTRAEAETDLDASVAVLTPREREVAALIASGMTNRQIAKALVIAERTADVHVSNILNKLTLTSRAQLAVWAVRHDLTV